MKPSVPNSTDQEGHTLSSIDIIIEIVYISNISSTPSKLYSFLTSLPLTSLSSSPSTLSYNQSIINFTDPFLRFSSSRNFSGVRKYPISILSKRDKDNSYHPNPTNYISTNLLPHQNRINVQGIQYNQNHVLLPNTTDVASTGIHSSIPQQQQYYTMNNPIKPEHAFNDILYFSSSKSVIENESFSESNINIPDITYLQPTNSNTRIINNSSVNYSVSTVDNSDNKLPKFITHSIGSPTTIVHTSTTATIITSAQINSCSNLSKLYPSSSITSIPKSHPKVGITEIELHSSSRLENNNSTGIPSHEDYNHQPFSQYSTKAVTPFVDNLVHEISNTKIANQVIPSITSPVVDIMNNKLVYDNDDDYDGFADYIMDQSTASRYDYNPQLDEGIKLEIITNFIKKYPDIELIEYNDYSDHNTVTNNTLSSLYFYSHRSNDIDQDDKSFSMSNSNHSGNESNRSIELGNVENISSSSSNPNFRISSHNSQSTYYSRSSILSPTSTGTTNSIKPYIPKLQLHFYTNYNNSTNTNIISSEINSNNSSLSTIPSFQDEFMMMATNGEMSDTWRAEAGLLPTVMHGV